MGAAGAAGMASAAPTEEDRDMAGELHRLLARSFVLPPDVRLDPDLRAAADAIAAAHLERMKGQLLSWVQEERSVQAGAGGKAKSTEVFHAATARMLNELAYWHIEPGDAEYERATLEAIRQSPSVCLTGQEPRFVDFSSRVLRLQAMPMAQRRLALASETQLLERWGKPRQAALPWPKVPPQDAALAAVAPLLAGGGRPPLPLPPALSSRLLSARDPYPDLPRETRCAFQRWWLQVGLAQGQPAGDVLNAFRYGTLVSAADRLGPTLPPAPVRPAADGLPPYPFLASRYDVTGATTVWRRFGADGESLLASVIDRKIAVRGIRGMRPIAFEDTFDAVATAHAIQTAGSGPTPLALRMNWHLDPPAAAGDTSADGMKR